jgi:hypothetical protein
MNIIELGRTEDHISQAGLDCMHMGSAIDQTTAVLLS